MNEVVRLPDLDRKTASADFRAAMRQLAGGVSVITAGQGDEITGMTVTSVSSLSADPPSLIVSVNRASSSWPLLQRHPFFGVNILSADQIDVAERFAGKDGLKGADRFAGRNGPCAIPARGFWPVRSRRSNARPRRSSSVIRMRSSSAACCMCSALRTMPRSPIGTASTSPSTGKRTC
jgi:Flavin reductase like domain